MHVCEMQTNRAFRRSVPWMLVSGPGTPMGDWPGKLQPCALAEVKRRLQNGTYMH